MKIFLNTLIFCALKIIEIALIIVVGWAFFKYRWLQIASFVYMVLVVLAAMIWGNIIWTKVISKWLKARGEK